MNRVSIKKKFKFLFLLKLSPKKIVRIIILDWLNKYFMAYLHFSSYKKKSDKIHASNVNKTNKKEQE